jgi:hypothetical protein
MSYLSEVEGSGNVNVTLQEQQGARAILFHGAADMRLLPVDFI